MAYYSVLDRMTLIGRAHFSQFMEWQNLGIKHLSMLYVPQTFIKNCRKTKYLTNFIDLTYSNFLTISHINYWNQVNSWKKLWKFWNGPLYRNKTDPSPLLNVAGYWKRSNAKACNKKLCQILANNIIMG